MTIKIVITTVFMIINEEEAISIGAYGINLINNENSDSCEIYDVIENLQDLSTLKKYVLDRCKSFLNDKNLEINDVNIYINKNKLENSKDFSSCDDINLHDIREEKEISKIYKKMMEKTKSAMCQIKFKSNKKTNKKIYIDTKKCQNISEIQDDSIKENSIEENHIELDNYEVKLIKKRKKKIKVITI